MFVCVYSVFVLFCVCVGRGLASKESCRLCKKIKKLKKRPKPNKGLQSHSSSSSSSSNSSSSSTGNNNNFESTPKIKLCSHYRFERKT
jgi:hypothetical protein